MLLKCISSADCDFTPGKIYSAYSNDGMDQDNFPFMVTSDFGDSYRVPLDGSLWVFEKVELADMLIRYADATPEQFEEIFRILHSNGSKYWRDVEHYLGLMSKPNNHICYFSEHAGLDGIDTPENHFGRASVYVTVQQFITALKDHYSEKSDENVPTPRYHRPRQAPPKRSVTSATIYYEDGSEYTLKHIDKVVYYKGYLTLFGRKEIAEGIEDSKLIKIKAGHVRGIVVKSLHQVTHIEKDFNQPEKWNMYREGIQILRAEQLEVEV